MTRILLISIILALAGVGMASDSATRSNTLGIYYADVEGGAATLIVTPAGESILVDAGWPGFDGRDAARIEKAMNAAGVSAIDHLIITHYHRDHYGGVPELARRVKVRNFYDHGAMQSLDEDKEFAARYAAYTAANGGKSITIKPGSSIRLKQSNGQPSLSILFLAARAEVATASKRPTDYNNSACKSATDKPEDKSDNARSLAFILRFGEFDFLDTGDLTWNIEHKLVCPNNLVGEIDLYQVSHHGMNISNNPVLLQSVKPTVAIMNNGPRKGGHPDTIRWLRELPSLKDIYQVHRNVTTADADNAPADFIANPDEKDDQAHLIRVTVDARQKTFTVTNDRNGLSKTYSLK